MTQAPNRTESRGLWTTAASTALATALAILAAWLLPDPSRRLLAMPSLALAGILAILAFRRIEPLWSQAPAPFAVSHQVTGRRRSIRISIGFVLLVLGAGLACWSLLAIWRQPFSWSQAGWWALGCGMLLAGAYASGLGRRATLRSTSETTTDRVAAAYPEKGGEGPRPQGYKLRAMGISVEPDSTGAGQPTAAKDSASGFGSRWLEIVLVVIIVLAGIWFRVYRIEGMPPGIFIDETNAALDALRILEGRADSLFGTGWFETPNGFVYLQTLFLRILGTNFWAIKLQSLLPGILTVIAMYFLAKEMFGMRTALFATSFLAFNRWHFNMSRWGWNEVYPPLIQITATLFLLRATRRGHLGDWAMAGFLLGLGMYTYLAIRLVAVTLLLYVLYRILIERGFLRRHWQGLILMAFLFALTFAPLAFTYIKNPFTFLNRTQQVSILNDVRVAGGSYEPLVESARRHLLMFHVQGDNNARHNLPGRPMLDPITAAFFALGTIWALWRWRDHRRGLLIIWLGITLLGGVFSQLNEAPQAYRTLTVVPAVVLLASDATDLALGGLILPLRSRSFWRWFWYGVATIVLLGVGWLNYDVYFRQQAQDASVYTAFSPLETTVANEVLTKRDDHRLYLSPRLYYFSPLRFLTYEPPSWIGINFGGIRYSPFSERGGGLDRPGYELANPALDLPLPDLGGDNASFLLDLHFQYLLDFFTYFYPGTQAQVVDDRLGRPLYLSVTIPGEEITALQAANRPEIASQITGLYIPVSGEYQITHSPAFEVLVDGDPLPSVSQFFGKGLHAISLTPVATPAVGPILSWEGPGVSGAIPDQHLFRQPPSGRGLLGQFYRGSEWQPPVVFSQVDPFLVASWPDSEPWLGPFSATWTGYLEIPVDGFYTFQLNADDGVRFWLDEAVIGESLQPDTVNQVNVSLDLRAGLHPLRIDYFQRGGGKALEFFWAPPGEPLQPVAQKYLTPN